MLFVSEVKTHSKTNDLLRWPRARDDPHRIHRAL